MNKQEQQDLKTYIAQIAAYYQRPLLDVVLKMYSDDLADLEYVAVIGAYESYRKNPKNKTIPLPAQIREIVQPVSTPEADGREIASRISSAIVKFGHSNAKEAEFFIGPTGWQIIQSSGGWSYLCENMGVSIDAGVFYAQVRDRATDRARGNGIDMFRHLAAPIVLNPKPEIEFTERREQQIAALIDHVSTKATALNIEIPPAKERKRMIAELLKGKGLP